MANRHDSEVVSVDGLGRLAEAEAEGLGPRGRRKV